MCVGCVYMCVYVCGYRKQKPQLDISQLVTGLGQNKGALSKLVRLLIGEIYAYTQSVDSILSIPYIIIILVKMFLVNFSSTVCSNNFRFLLSF